MATSPTTASSFSPYWESESRTRTATKKRAMLAGTAISAPRRIGFRSGRLTPIMLAVIAAMIRIASRPSRKTISAAFVITVPALSPSPVLARASSSFSSRTSRVARTSRAPASSAISCARPFSPLAPYHINPSISVARPGSKARSLISGPNSKKA